MKKIILCLVTLIAFMSCEMTPTDAPNDKVKVSFGLDIPASESRNISAIATPTVNYTLEKAGTVYQSGLNVPLVSNGTNYQLDLILLAGNSYSFTQFDVFDGSTLMYSLDVNKTSDSFAVDANGLITPNPATIYLMYQLGDGFDDVTAANSLMEIKTDYQALRNLTFKVTIPSTSTTTVKVQHKSNVSHWTEILYKTALADGDVYDMDTRTLQDYSNEGDDNITTYGNETGASDEFRLLITKDSATTILYFTSADFNKKDIVFK